MSQYRKIVAAALVAMPIAALSISGAQASGERNHRGANAGHAERGPSHVNRQLRLAYPRFNSERGHVRPFWLGWNQRHGNRNRSH